MAYRCIVIESAARLSVRSEQLLVQTDVDRVVPIEDISAILLESQNSTVTTAALSQLGSSGCAVFVCDEKHMPCAVLEPFHGYRRELSVVNAQMNQGEVQKKRLWQCIVKRKIHNQALCLAQAGYAHEATALFSMEKQVKSGDTGNLEATAAQLYFPVLFGKGFTRSQEHIRNAALNYGYAILRASIARYLAVYGFLPVLGLHHHNTLNNFNLADDLIEAFRPVVDYLVYENVDENMELSPALKRLLFNVLNLDILSGGQHHSVNYAIERLVQSLGRVFQSDAAELLLPEWIPPAIHRYE